MYSLRQDKTMKIEDITLNKKNLSQPSPVSGWARVVGQDKISITNPDTSFDYLRLYSIQRTSLNGTPIVKIVGDYKLKNTD